MPKDYRVHLDDMIYCLDRLQVLCNGLEYGELVTDLTRQEAILRNLEVIGEAARHLPTRFRDQHPEIDWIRIAGLRDILIHEYCSVDLDIVWDLIQNKLPVLNNRIRAIPIE